MNKSKVDNVLDKYKNNKYLALLISVGIIVIALATFTDALKNLLTTIDELAGTPAPVDISGKWRVEETENTILTYFDFKVVDDKLYGTVWLNQTWRMQQGESGILDGQIVGNQVSFDTKHEVVREFGQYDFEGNPTTPTVTVDLVAHYDGEVKEDGIHFRKQTGGGYYTEFLAKKIVDLTETVIAEATPEDSIGYKLAYVLTGHEDGVLSLSFGPNNGRLRSGGLRLVSGGSNDGKIKYWDVATAEYRGAGNLHDTENGDFVYLAHDPESKSGPVRLTALGISKDMHNSTFGSLYTYRSGQGGASWRTRELSGDLRSVAISGNSHVLAIAETKPTSECIVTLYSKHADVKRVLSCEGVVRSLSLSHDGNLIASAEDMKSSRTTLKLWDTATGTMKWRASYEASISHLAFSSNGRFLASADVTDGKIRIVDVSTGALEFELSEGQDNGVSFMTFSNSGDLLASASYPSGVIKLWNAHTGILEHTIENGEAVGALSFSFDDKLLATGSAEMGFIKVWAKPRNPETVK